MLNKIKNYIVFFAATFNITALVLFYVARGYEMTRPFESDTYESVGWWFGLGSVLLWLIYLLLFIAAKLRKSSK